MIVVTAIIRAIMLPKDSKDDKALQFNWCFSGLVCLAPKVDALRFAATDCLIA